MVDPAGSGLTSTTGYADSLRQVFEFNAFGNFTITTLDALGRQVSVQDEAGKTTAFEYDDRGNLVRQTPPTGVPDDQTLFSYDALGRLVAVKQGVDMRTTDYDANGRVLRETDFEGNVTLFDYDDAGRLTRQVDAFATADEAVTKFAYDASGNLIAVVDANHAEPFSETVASGEIKAVEYEYDELNRRDKQIDPEGTNPEQKVEYDPSGNAVETTLRDGTVVVRTYDALNRVVKVTVDNDVEQQFAYDDLGRLVKAFDYNENLSTRATGFRVRLRGPGAGGDRGRARRARQPDARRGDRVQQLGPDESAEWIADGSDELQRRSADNGCQPYREKDLSIWSADQI